MNSIVFTLPFHMLFMWCKAQKEHVVVTCTPNAHVITKHLSATTGTTVTLTPMDYIHVCYKCYRAHVSIMKDTTDTMHTDLDTHIQGYRHACKINSYGFTILMEQTPLTGRILKFKIKLERRWNSSKDELARKDTIVTGVTIQGKLLWPWV